MNISHRNMPTWAQHTKFISSRPYAVWYLIKWRANYVGAVYLTKMNEIGISILADWRGRGLGKQAILALMRKHSKKRFLANINPRNEKSIKMFRGLGFHIIQQTYELRS